MCIMANNIVFSFFNKAVGNCKLFNMVKVVQQCKNSTGYISVGHLKIQNNKIIFLLHEKIRKSEIYIYSGFYSLNLSDRYCVLWHVAKTFLTETYLFNYFRVCGYVNELFMFISVISLRSSPCSITVAIKLITCAQTAILNCHQHYDWLLEKFKSSVLVNVFF